MALNLRAPQSERYRSEPYDAEPDHEPGGGLPLGAAAPDWDDEDAARNPAGMGEDLYYHSGSLRRWIRGGFGLLALAGFLGVLWYAYEWGLGGGDAVELPTVQAEAGPEKVKPADPGGLQVPYQDQLVLNQGETAGPNVERLLPPPEAPLATQELAQIAPSYDEPVDALPLEGEVAPLQPAGEPLAAELPAEVQAVETVPELPAAPSNQAAETQTSGQSVPQSAAPEPSAPEPAAPQPAATETQAATTQTAAAPATQPAQASGDFAVQLVSLKNRGAAEAEWRRLQGVFPSLLGDKSLLLQSAEVAGVGTVYRLRAGPFATRAKAAQVCARLKSKQQDCLVVNR